MKSIFFRTGGISDIFVDRKSFFGYDTTIEYNPETREFLKVIFKSSIHWDFRKSRFLSLHLYPDPSFPQDHQVCGFTIKEKSKKDVSYMGSQVYEYTFSVGP